MLYCNASKDRILFGNARAICILLPEKCCLFCTGCILFSIAVQYIDFIYHAMYVRRTYTHKHVLQDIIIGTTSKEQHDSCLLKRKKCSTAQSPKAGIKRSKFCKKGHRVLSTTVLLRNQPCMLKVYFWNNNEKATWIRSHLIPQHF